MLDNLKVKYGVGSIAPQNIPKQSSPNTGGVLSNLKLKYGVIQQPTAPTAPIPTISEAQTPKKRNSVLKFFDKLFGVSKEKKQQTFAVGEGMENYQPSNQEILKLGMGPIRKDSKFQTESGEKNVSQMIAEQNIRKTPSYRSSTPDDTAVEFVKSATNPVTYVQMPLNFIEKGILQTLSKEQRDKVRADPLFQKVMKNMVGTEQPVSFSEQYGEAREKYGAGKGTALAIGETVMDVLSILPILHLAGIKVANPKTGKVPTEAEIKTALIKNGIPEAEVSKLKFATPEQRVGSLGRLKEKYGVKTTDVAKSPSVVQESTTLGRSGRTQPALSEFPLAENRAKIPESLSSESSAVSRLYDRGKTFVKTLARKGESVKTPQEKPLDVFRSIEGRLERLTPQTKKIAKLFREADTKNLVSAGRVTKQYQAVKKSIKKISNEELLNVTEALEGRVKPTVLTDGGKKLYDFFDSYRKLIAKKSVDFGVKIKNSKGQLSDFKPRENYVPHYVVSADDLKNLEIRRDVINSTVKRGEFKSIQEAEARLKDYEKYLQDDNVRNLDFFANKLVEEGRANTIEQARGQITRYFRASRQQRMGNLEQAREINFPFYDPNPLRYISRYVYGAEKRLADVEVFGVNLENVDTLLGGIKNETARKTARQLVKVAREAIEPGDFANVTNKIQQIGTTRLNPMTSVTNLGQNINTLLASDAPSLIKGIVRSLSKNGSVSVESGSIAESVLRQVQRQAGAKGTTIGKYIKSIGFGLSEKINRSVASNTGFEWTKKLVKALEKNPNNNTIRKALKDIGLDPEKILKNGATRDDLLAGAKEFTDMTQFRSRAIDLPASATDSNLGRLVWQFKTFAYQQARFLSKMTIDEIRAGNYGRATRNLAVIATVFPLTGEALADLRSLISGRERTTRGLTRYLENAAMVGAFGIMYDTVKSLATGDVAKFIAGPGIGTLSDVGEAAYNSITNGLNKKTLSGLLRVVPSSNVYANRIFPTEVKEKNPNLRPEEEKSYTTPFGETTIPLARFNVDAKNVSLKKQYAEEFHQDMIFALNQSVTEARGDEDEFNKLWRKAKAKVKADWLEYGKLTPDKIFGENRETEGSANLFTVIGNYGKGIVKDPENTLKALFTEERLRKVVGDVSVFERKKFLSLLDKGDKNTVIDHKIPLSLGGSNDPSNLAVISEKENQEKAKIEVKLLDLIKIGQITKKQAQEIMKDWKNAKLP